MSSLKAVICPKCGWNHFGVTREYAWIQSLEFFNWWKDQPENVRLMYSSKDDHSVAKSMHSYEHCFRCGNEYKNLKTAEDFTSPLGSTLQPIIFPNE